MPVLKRSVVDEDIAAVISADLPWERFRGCRILVTGAAGFLPAYMVEALLALKQARGIECQVIGLVRNLARAHERFAGVSNGQALQLQAVESRWNLEELGTLHYIIHAASNASPPSYLGSRLATIYPNVVGTYALAELAAQNPLQGFLYFSSAEVYGALPAGIEYVHEHEYGVVDPTNPRAVYSESKRSGESICLAARAEWQVPTQIVRPFHTYGPGLRLDDGRIFADLIRDIVTGQTLHIQSSGTAVRSFCYLRDATEAFFRVLLLGDGCPYNVGNPAASVSVNELAETLVQSFPEKHLQIERATLGKQDIGGAVSIIRPDVSRVKALGWCPKVGIAEGFKRAVASFSADYA